MNDRGAGNVYWLPCKGGYAANFTNMIIAGFGDGFA